MKNKIIEKNHNITPTEIEIFNYIDSNADILDEDVEREQELLLKEEGRFTAYKFIDYLRECIIDEIDTFWKNKYLQCHKSEYVFTEDDVYYDDNSYWISKLLTEFPSKYQTILLEIEYKIKEEEEFILEYERLVPNEVHAVYTYILNTYSTTFEDSNEEQQVEELDSIYSAKETNLMIQKIKQELSF